MDIHDGLTKWYDTIILNKHEKIRDILLRRRCLDWIILHLTQRRSHLLFPDLVSGALYFQQYLPENMYNETLGKLNLYDKFTESFPSWLRQVIPFSCGSVLIDNKVTINNPKEMGDYIGIIYICKTSTAMTLTMKLDDGHSEMKLRPNTAIILSYQARYLWTSNIKCSKDGYLIICHHPRKSYPPLAIIDQFLPINLKK